MNFWDFANKNPILALCVLCIVMWGIAEIVETVCDYVNAKLERKK
jgi:hypothetical protein